MRDGAVVFVLEFIVAWLRGHRWGRYPAAADDAATTAAPKSALAAGPTAATSISTVPTGPSPPAVSPRPIQPAPTAPARAWSLSLLGRCSLSSRAATIAAAYTIVAAAASTVASAIASAIASAVASAVASAASVLFWATVARQPDHTTLRPRPRRRTAVPRMGRGGARRPQRRPTR